MPLPNAPHVSLREAILWIAYGDAKPGDDLSGDGLWLNQEKEEIVDARTGLWSALENGSLEASALGPDGTPVTIAKHEWRFLFGRYVRNYSFELGQFVGRSPTVVRQTVGDGLYVKNPYRPAMSLSGVDGPPRFIRVAIPRDSLLFIWPPRVQATAAPGRPSIMNKIEAELDRWIEGGFPVLSSELKKHNQGSDRSVAAISRALASWAVQCGLKASPDDAPRPKSIENKLRSKLQKALDLL
jgi:hypothetical protein